MFGKKTVTLVLAMAAVMVGTAAAQSLEDNWNDLLHYTKIGRFDLARGYAEAVLDSEPDPVELLALSEQNQQGYQILLRVTEAAPDEQLARLSREILEIIEQGRFIRRSDPKVVLAEIKRLSTTTRGQLAAVRRLRNAGEYAIPFMLDALADSSRRDEWPNIIWAMPQIGKDAIRPLAAALQGKDVGIKAEIIGALGQIGYEQSLAYLKLAAEKEPSAELRTAAEQAILKINPNAMNLSAAELFYGLGSQYYNHAESLAPAEEGPLSNIWFWDSDKASLYRQPVDSLYFNELMAMRCCEWALKANPEFGQAIGLWLAAFFRAESTGIKMPAYFGEGHADAFVYATTAGPEYLHQALARALGDGDAYVALGTIEALAVTAGRRSLFHQVGASQPLMQAVAFNNKAVRCSAAVAIALAGPDISFPESGMVTQTLAGALSDTDDQPDNPWVAEGYALRAAKALLKLARTQNAVIDLTAAQAALIDATRDKRPQIQKLAAEVLAYLPAPQAQQAIAVTALSENNSMQVRLAAFDSLALSARVNANMLDEQTVDAIYALVGSAETEPQLRSAAAGAFGALNLPSRKAKDLILDQAKS